MNNVHIKTPEEIEIIAENGKVLHNVLQTLASATKPGVTSLELNEIAEQIIAEAGATPSFKGYQGFPAAICASINDEVVHGIPDDRILQEGDIISIDAGVYKNGFHSDSAITVAVGKISKEAQKLMDVTKKALHMGIKVARPGERLGLIGYTIQTFVEKEGYGVVRELVGHGIGRDLHEEPSVPNYGSRDGGMILKEGMVIAIEPMITLGDYRVKMNHREWVVKTLDGELSAHFEHTLAITSKGARILT